MLWHSFDKAVMTALLVKDLVQPTYKTSNAYTAVKVYNMYVQGTRILHVDSHNFYWFGGRQLTVSRGNRLLNRGTLCSAYGFQGMLQLQTSDLASRSHVESNYT
jgi:hypothetical protein